MDNNGYFYFLQIIMPLSRQAINENELYLNYEKNLLIIIGNVPHFGIVSSIGGFGSFLWKRWNCNHRNYRLLQSWAGVGCAARWKDYCCGRSRGTLAL